MTKRTQKMYTKDTINGYVYAKKITINSKIIYGMEYKGSKLCSHVLVFNLIMERPPRGRHPGWQGLPQLLGTI